MIQRVNLPSDSAAEASGDQGFTVHLERVFQGPLDLLLQLVREKELEIHAVSLASVCDAYCQYVRDLKKVDVEESADYLIIAATLLSIKSKSLLPSEEVEADEDPFEPGEELVQQLLAYKALRQAADQLTDCWNHRRSQLAAGGKWLGKQAVEEEPEEQQIDLSDLSLWDILQTYRRLEQETGFSRPHRLRSAGKPLRFYVQKLWNDLQAVVQTSYQELLQQSDQPGPDEAAYYLVALLELAKQHAVDLSQEEPFGNVLVRRSAGSAQVNLDEVDEAYGEGRDEGEQEMDELLSETEDSPPKDGK